jgi:hypothetical protein
MLKKSSLNRLLFFWQQFGNKRGKLYINNIKFILFRLQKENQRKLKNTKETLTCIMYVNRKYRFLLYLKLKKNIGNNLATFLAT